MLEPIFYLFVNILLWVMICAFYYFNALWFKDCWWHTIKRKEGFVTGIHEYEVGSALSTCFFMIASILVIWYLEKVTCIGSDLFT